MSSICPHCGANVRLNASFCSTCGQPIQPSRPVPTATGPGTPRLMVQEPGQASRSAPVTGPHFTIGRAPANDLTIDNPAVSRQHARLEQRGASYWIVDLGSTNGTMVNGQRIESQALQEGDIIRIGDPQGNSVGLTFHSGIAPRRYAGTIRLGQLNLTQKPVLTIGRDPASQIPLNHPLVSYHHARVEQTPQGHLIRDLKSNNGTFVNGQRVSGTQPLKPHDVIHIGPFKLVYDRGELAQYTPAGNYRLDAISLVRAVSLERAWARFRGADGQPRQKLILNNISLSIYPKEFVALVGGSGAGKSTLMQALSGFVPAEGQVLINGDDLYANFAAYRNILGYVPQDDIIHQQLTVRSALTHAARLRLPDASRLELEERIETVLEAVELVDHQHKPVKTLSGGQRKRVSIAVELLAEPGLFFLDEPTSGLDPGLEKKMMHTMRTLADGGRTIVLVTHATANIDQCTHVAFLADGYLAYFGPPNEALTFFESPDFADIYTRLTQPLDLAKTPLPAACQPHYQQLQAARPDQPPSTAEVWAKTFAASSQYRQYVADRLPAANSSSQSLAQPTSVSAARFVTNLKQFWILALRYFELIRRDALSLFILLAVMPLIGLLLLIMTDRDDLVGKSPGEIRQEIRQEIRDNQADGDPAVADEQFQGSYEVAGQTQKLLFMMALAANLLGIFAAAYEIIKEEPIYRRERMVNLKIPPYLLSKLTVLAIFALLQCLLFLLVVRLGVRYPDWGVFLPSGLEMYITLFLATLASISLGLLISAGVRSSGTVIYLILLILFVQIIFAGAIFELPPAAKPISLLTTSRWTLEALGSSVNIEELKDQGVTCVEFEDDTMRQMQEQSGNVSEICARDQMEQPVDYEFNVNYAYSVGHLFSRWLVLGGFTVVFAGLTVLLIKRKDVV